MGSQFLLTNPDFFFFTKFAACFDLLKTAFLFENPNIQSNANVSNHLFYQKVKKNVNKQKQIDNSGFVITRFVMKSSLEQIKC